MIRMDQTQLFHHIQVCSALRGCLGKDAVAAYNELMDHQPDQVVTQKPQLMDNVEQFLRTAAPTAPLRH